MKHTVLTRIFAGHKRSPCRWRNWWQNRPKGSGNTFLHQLCKVGHAAFGHPWTDQCPRRRIQSDDYDLWILFHVGSRFIDYVVRISAQNFVSAAMLEIIYLYTRHVCIPVASNRKSITRAPIALRRSRTIWRL